MKLGIYGGSFNPPHLGHTTSAQFAMEALGLDQLFFVPAAEPPHKQLPPDVPPAEMRLAMATIAADGLLLPERVAVSGMELERQGVSYTADTLEQLAQDYPGAELYLLMGSDMLLTLQSWHEPQRILHIARIAAFARSGSDQMAELEIHAAALRDSLGARIEVLALPELVEISSTRLRSLLADGVGQEFLHPAVYGYILRHGLYGTRADLKHLTDEQLRACAYSMVRCKRIAHIRGTEEEAVRLATRWGADQAKAARAGILHDCTKYLEMDAQLQLCRNYGIVLDELEQQAVKLLHAKTGACIARDIYGVDDDIFSAIYWHTTGKANMSLLEKIIYIADYIEPNRTFEGVETLRKLAYRDLDAAVLAGCQTSIAEMEERKLPVHPNTLQARDWLGKK